MAFISVSFLVFVAVVCILYFVIPKRFQWIVLLLASYLFYMFSRPAALFFLLFTTASTFYTGVLLGKANDRYTNALAQNSSDLTKEQKKELKQKNKREKSLVLAVSLVINFGILAFLKYFNFFSSSANAVLSFLPFDTSIPTLNLLLPLGISFYTFQSTGYVIDVYRGKYQPDKNIARYALFVSFFPQLIQGPISRYDDLAHQLFEPHAFDYTRAKFGMQLMMWGFFKKMVIADRVAILVNTVFDNYMQYSGITVFIGVMMYCVQIYCDFSGGIDVARGVAQILGIQLVSNFERPFFATSIADFWRRWHITLNSWMRDYIFYPLSLSKSFTKLGRSSRKILGNYLGKLLPTFLAMLITFLAVGIWHGSSWKYVAYGLYNGILIFMGILFEPLSHRITEKLNIRTNTFSWRLFQMLRTFLLVCVGRYFSRAPSFKAAINMMSQTTSVFNPWVLFDGTILNLGLDGPNLIVLSVSLAILLIVGIYQERGHSIRQRISEQNIAFRWITYLTAIFAILIFGVYGLGYNAANFIYMGF